mmetsp:Transcript_4117/g.7593  ORF Transcript_4117/g.7593 Transcript_4117/m.7593 type:complete len:148 (-) Transcript_4117:59-502(-)|eukprot:CAMPEP_0197521976 /NCGR_PEP_ID=MMETSP1318-20131121/7185_1 /TAXON_ID=552666 /ORGANISM="Partenskyella glossopodia, Strain RCC365" /LENGTH=147 /DNA_ID=CAMNT_0043074167 /DNA_START=106 /DNA_END=549 /DNA_ORIENTATION=-
MTAHDYSKPTEKKQQKTLAQAHEEDILEPTCAEATEQCWEDCKITMYHKDELGTPLYCHNTPSGWGQMIVFFICLYAFFTAWFSLLLYLSQAFGTAVLWGYLGVFLVFVIGLSVLIYLGQKHHDVVEASKRASRRACGLAADEKALV